MDMQFQIKNGKINAEITEMLGLEPLSLVIRGLDMEPFSGLLLLNIRIMTNGSNAV